MIETKKTLLIFLEEKLDYYLNYEKNPFLEMRMVTYINNGIKRLNNLNVDDDDFVIMYDENETLKFKVL